MAFWDGRRWVPPDVHRPTPKRRTAADWIATLVMIVGIAALAVGGSTRANLPLLNFDPATAPGGTKVVVVGYGLPSQVAVQLDWDGSTAGMPKARTTNRGTFTARFQVPVANPGNHTVNVRATGTTGRKNHAIVAGTLLAAGVFVVSVAAPSPSSSEGTGDASTPTPAASSPGPTSPPPSADPTPNDVTPSPAPITPSPSPTSAQSPTPTPGPNSPSPSAAGTTWVTVIDDQFASGGVPSHWGLYDGPYGSGPQNCATPSHVSVSGGSMHMLMRYETSGKCGHGWYSAGMYARGADSIDQRVTVRFRVVADGIVAHRIIPMRWPTGGTWPVDGEEDYCEGSSLTGCSSFLHYGVSNLQVSQSHSVDLSQWHTLRFERLDHVVRAYIDDLSTPSWTYVGSAVTLPDTLKHVVLQQECKATGCPAGTAGSEDIQIDWITIAVPAG